MARQALTDNLWEQLQSTMKDHGCYQTQNSREIMEATLWKLRTGAPWRDIPKELCSWKTVYNRLQPFQSVVKDGLVGEILFRLRKQIDTEWVFTDGSYIRCHQHASGARLGEDQAIGQSRGGATTKIHLSCDANGYPLDFKITGGEVHDSQVAGELIDMIGQADYFIADKGYESEAIRDKARSHNMIPVVPKRKNAKQPNPEFDSYLYKLRHLVENMFARLKHFRSIAPRYEKLARNFNSMLYLACTIVHCKMN